MRAFAIPDIQGANPRMKLTWNLNDPAQGVVNYRVFVGPQSTNEPALFVTATNAPPLQLDFMLGRTNGVYRFELTAVNSAGLESPNSVPLWLFWYGHPTAPDGIGMIFE